MAYIKYKEITKYFYFSRVLDKTKLPSYVYEYVFDGESILAAYKTRTDHGIFTDKKIVLFDNYSLFGIKKVICTIPYKTISTCAITFDASKAEMSFYMDSGYPVRLKFVDLTPRDKLRLRCLYAIIIKWVNNQTVRKEELQELIDESFSFPDEKK